MHRRAFTIVLSLCSAGCGLGDLLPPDVPKAPAVERSVTLEQGWTDEQRHWFHHASQGTATMLVPYEWFVALEQPDISLSESPLLSDPEFLQRFGFVASRQSPENPHGLPVGFARDGEFADPMTGEKYTALGFTCAACHTGHLEYRGTEVRIEGGPAMTDLGKFRTTLGLAVGYTKYIPRRFGRFADRVLGDDHSEADEEQLKESLAKFLERVGKLRAAEKTIDADCTEEGFCRLDALARIGNFVFGTGLDNVKNMAPRRAPVNYPHIWDTPWFDWVQYNGSIHQPMTRNAGEAMGVLALVNFLGKDPDRYRSTVRVDNLHRIERQLAGPAPELHANGGAPQPLFRGLRAPKWPEEILGKIDTQRAAAGEQLYRQHCTPCHLPALDSPEIRDDRHWTAPNEAGERYLKLRMVDTDLVGTDPNQAAGMRTRKVDTGPLGFGTMDFGPALAKVVELTVTRWYDERPTPLTAAERRAMNGNRDNLVRADMAYRARPLDGIWATAPYLHNGAVPNLYLMLSPAAERPRRIYLGSRQFDPKEVGFEYAELDGSFLLDTSLPGNSNAGHEFRDGPQGNGVIGPAFTDEQRWQLIEYLKTL